MKNYIPSANLAFCNWALNFATLAAAAPANYGLTAPDVATILAEVNAWKTLCDTSTNPATRTPVTIQARNTARIILEGKLRALAKKANGAPETTDQERVALGLTVRSNGGAPIPAPVSTPNTVLRSQEQGRIVTVGYEDSIAPQGQAKPAGCTGVDVHVQTGNAPGVDPDQATFLTTITRSPSRLNIPGTGAVATIWTRYRTASGPGGQAQFGPWGAALIVTLA